MARKPKLIITLFGVIFLSCFGRETSAGVLLVEGDIDSFHMVAQTKYLGKKPVLLFTEQQSLNVEVLFKVNNFLFKDSSWEDLAVRLSGGKRLVVDGEAQFSIENPGIYTVYFVGGSYTQNILGFKTEIDGGKAPYRVGNEVPPSGRRYVKLGEVEWGKGRHKIKIKDGATVKQNLKINLFLVNKREVEKMQGVVWQAINRPQAEVSYIFEADKAGFWVKEAGPKREGSQYALKLMLLPEKSMGIKNSGNESAPVSSDSGDIPLVKIGGRILKLKDFEISRNTGGSGKGMVAVKRLVLENGRQQYEKLENGAFRVAWLLIEPVGQPAENAADNAPEITFTRINPTKYLVKVENAKEAFWLVFSQMFHEGWGLYALLAPEDPFRFSLADLKFLFKAPLEARHYQVNAYANGWYIEPKKLDLGENFILVIYYWPQNFFYLGYVFSGIGLAVSLVSLVIIKCRKKSF